MTEEKAYNLRACGIDVARFIWKDGASASMRALTIGPEKARSYNVRVYARTPFGYKILDIMTDQGIDVFSMADALRILEMLEGASTFTCVIAGRTGRITLDDVARQIREVCGV